MAEEYKSSKTRQVMNLINAKPSGVNPFLPPAEQEREKKSLAESTVEDKLRYYTQSKRGTSPSSSRDRLGRRVGAGAWAPCEGTSRILKDAVLSGSMV